MGMRALDPVAYGKLLAAELPQPIQNDRAFDSMVARLEELDFAQRKLTQEEKALFEKLIAGQETLRIHGSIPAEKYEKGSNAYFQVDKAELVQ